MKDRKIIIVSCGLFIGGVFTAYGISIALNSAIPSVFRLLICGGYFVLASFILRKGILQLTRFNK